MLDLSHELNPQFLSAFTEIP